MFILVTGTWVALRQSFAVSNRVAEASLPASPTVTSPRSATLRASASQPIDEHPGIQRQGTFLSAIVKSDNSAAATSALPRRAKSVGSGTSLNLLSKTLGRNGTPNIPQVVPETEKSQSLVPPEVRQRRAVSVPPPSPAQLPPSPTVGCGARSFPSRNRHSTPIPLTNSPIDTLTAAVTTPLEYPAHKRGRFGFRRIVTGIFRPRRSTE